MTRNEAIKYAVDREPHRLDDVLEMANKLTAVDPKWQDKVGDGYTLQQLTTLYDDLSHGRQQKPLPHQPDVVEGIFTIKSHDFGKQGVDVLEYENKPFVSHFYLTKICRNCGVGMSIRFETIPVDIKSIKNAMLTLERAFNQAGHEEAEL